MLEGYIALVGSPPFTWTQWFPVGLRIGGTSAEDMHVLVGDLTARLILVERCLILVRPIFAAPDPARYACTL